MTVKYEIAIIKSDILAAPTPKQSNITNIRECFLYYNFVSTQRNVLASFVPLRLPAQSSSPRRSAGAMCLLCRAETFLYRKGQTHFCGAREMRMNSGSTFGFSRHD